MMSDSGPAAQGGQQPVDPCVLPLGTQGARDYPFIMIMFGGAGDLARKKLAPTLFRPYRDNLLAHDFRVIGFARTQLNSQAYMAMIKESVIKHCEDPAPEDMLNEFVSHFEFISANFEDDSKYEEVRAAVEKGLPGVSQENLNLLHYLAAPPDSAPVIIDRLKHHGLAQGPGRVRVIMEKPFGGDRASARALNQRVLNAFDENQVFRIDHYLGKETVQNLMFFRFGNNVFEPLWNRNYVDHIQITAAEDIGIETRGNFYEQAGVVRDIIQNHMLQLAAHTAMEPPASFDADAVRDEKFKIYKSFRKVDEEYLRHNMVRGQYGPGRYGEQAVPGYREEANVAKDSVSPTFFAGKFYIDNWRWSGVPFYLRAGKRLNKRITEIYVEFKQPPLKLMGSACQDAPNALHLQIQPEESITLRFNAKQPGVGNIPHPSLLEFNYSKAFQTASYPPYARLLLDCLRGDLTLFARQDGVEAMWSVVDPIIQYWEDNPPANFPNYKAGTWGPEDADELMGRDGRRWRDFA
ncbi:glucose-6-phosphate dehydrogenase [Desulfatibacillum aliphaticivorans]|nr:glucose-6-phosphate dehydrogenase [Desulfatibacillum aliphaticivorans]